ncbi:unnamed protein product [Vitrella brassicaformis CCMP3155]|uniref:Uncharacterized protein n=1 Tax=Vitrella brassicaformis (strain CCMP3155) TaxID=1169540 RepID=A0A0G4F621_VITBC|nr:unnamed protein product [Vitrella brassicaformis CCMP3155]|eukprot:CEM07827.1 unnamed protein product [Vitrella brassicaformis CCMP3155]
MKTKPQQEGCDRMRTVMARRFLRTAVVLVVLACSGAVAAPSDLAYQVNRVLDHDHECFTQGLLFIDNTTVLETCGLYRKSRIKKYTYPDLTLLKETNIPDKFFAEGAAIWNGRVFVLTWREKRILVYNLTTLELLNELDYPYDGWGLAYAHDAEEPGTFYATNGSAYVMELRIPADASSVDVRAAREVSCFNGVPTEELNEIEYVTPFVYANVWFQEYIVRVDPTTGDCLGELGLKGVHLSNTAGNGKRDVLNGIAFKNNIWTHKLLVTGKLWDKMYELLTDDPVTLVASPSECDSASGADCDTPSAGDSLGALVDRESDPDEMEVTEGDQQQRSGGTNRTSNATHRNVSRQEDMRANKGRKRGNMVKDMARAGRDEEWKPADSFIEDQEEAPLAAADEQHVIFQILEFLSSACGVIYVFCWTFSFYPQVWLNYTRKSCVGFSFDLAWLNIVGFAAYSTYTVVRYVIQIRHNLAFAVELHDVFFSVHALFICSVLGYQILIYEKGGQTIGWPARILSGALILLLVVQMGMASMGVIPWYTIHHHHALPATANVEGSLRDSTHWRRALDGFLAADDGHRRRQLGAVESSISGGAGVSTLLWSLQGWSVVSYLGLVKAFITIVKYIPQILLNYRNKSTKGMAIQQILLDISGGIFSLLQNCIDAIAFSDADYILENIPKMLIGGASMAYDILLILQHYVFYREGHRLKYTAVSTSDKDNIFITGGMAFYTPAAKLSREKDKKAAKAPLPAPLPISSSHQQASTAAEAGSRRESPGSNKSRGRIGEGRSGSGQGGVGGGLQIATDANTSASGHPPGSPSKWGSGRGGKARRQASPF